MSKDRVEILEIIDGAVIHSGHADVPQALELGGSDVLEEPSREGGGEDFEIFAQGRGQRAQGAIFTSGKVDSFFTGAREEAGFGGWGSCGRLGFGDRSG